MQAGAFIGEIGVLGIYSTTWMSFPIRMANTEPYCRSAKTGAGWWSGRVAIRLIKQISNPQQ